MPIRTIEVRERVLAENDRRARQLRELFRDAGTTVFNLVSSPGSGKTLLLERTLRDVGEELGISVITGDVQTRNDAERLAQHTSRLVQAVVTGGGCHLDSSQIEAAVAALDLDSTRLLFIENVGNLVCPANWDLGETAKIVVLSVTEGEDKPLKYPAMFRRATYAVMNKIDLLPYLPFKMDWAVACAHEINPDLRFFYTSAHTGEGLEGWYNFLREQVSAPARVR